MAAANALLNSLEIGWQAQFDDKVQLLCLLFSIFYYINNWFSLYFYFVSKQQEILIMQGVCDASQSKYHEEAIIAMQTLVIFDKHMCKFMNVKNVLF